MVEILHVVQGSPGTHTGSVTTARFLWVEILAAWLSPTRLPPIAAMVLLKDAILRDYVGMDDAEGKRVALNISILLGQTGRPPKAQEGWKILRQWAVESGLRPEDILKKSRSNPPPAVAWKKVGVSPAPDRYVPPPNPPPGPVIHPIETAFKAGLYGRKVGLREGDRHVTLNDLNTYVAIGSRDLGIRLLDLAIPAKNQVIDKEGHPTLRLVTTTKSGSADYHLVGLQVLVGREAEIRYQTASRYTQLHFLWHPQSGHYVIDRVTGSHALEVGLSWLGGLGIPVVHPAEQKNVADMWGVQYRPHSEGDRKLRNDVSHLQKPEVAERLARIRSLISPQRSHSQRGAVLVEAIPLVLPFRAAAAGIDIAFRWVDHLPRPMGSTVRYGFNFLAGMMGAKLLTGQWDYFKKSSVMDVVPRMTLLGIGGYAGECLAKVVATSFMGEVLPLLGGIIALEWGENGKLNLANVPAVAANAMAASGAVRLGTQILLGSRRLRQWGGMINLISAAGAATPLGAMVKTVAQFTVMEVVGIGMKRWAAIEDMHHVKDAVMHCLAQSQKLMGRMASGYDVGKELKAVDENLSELSLIARLRQDADIRAEYDQKRGTLERWRTSAMDNRLQTGKSVAEIDEYYSARMRAMDRDEHRDLSEKNSRRMLTFSRLPVVTTPPSEAPLEVVSMSLPHDMAESDHDPMAKTLRDDLSNDWEGLSEQLAQYQRDLRRAIQSEILHPASPASTGPEDRLLVMK